MTENKSLEERTERDPLIFLFTGPSGSGKATVMQGVIEGDHTLERVPTYTTRPKRPSEQDGIDYNFISQENFKKLIEEGKLLEYEQVYGDHYYGSPKLMPKKGEADKVIELDYRGHKKLCAIYLNTVSIFIIPPTFAQLEERITKRSQVQDLKDRLKHALDQLEHAPEYDYILVNDSQERCIQDALSVIRTERIKHDMPFLLRKIQKEIKDNKG